MPCAHLFGYYIIPGAEGGGTRVEFFKDQTEIPNNYSRNHYGYKIFKFCPYCGLQLNSLISNHNSKEFSKINVDGIRQQAIEQAYINIIRRCLR